MTETQIFYPLHNDTIFKNTFSTEDSLKRLLKDILNINVTKILSNNIELPIDNIHERRKYLDLILETDQGIISVELNHSYKDEIPNRNLLYFFKLISSTVQRNNSYANIGRHIQLNITWNLKNYFNFDIKNRKYVKCYIMDEETHNKINSDIFEIVHINMDYFKEVWYHKNVEKENPFLMLLAAESIKEIDKICEVDVSLKKIGNRIKELNKDQKILDVIIENEDEIIANSLYERGMEKGIKQGIERGIEQGIEQGMSKGAQQKKLEIAKSMLDNKIGVETILKCTGLSHEELDKLK